MEDKGPLSHLLTQNLPPIEVTPEEAKQLGYMPYRNVFEREYDPTAEQLVSNLSLNADDEDVDLLLKLAQVDIYTRRLRERTRRKRIVRDFQLISNFFRGNQANSRRRQSKEQREFRDRFRVFGQFFTSNEFERRLNSFQREKSLRIRLSELSRYRWNGLTRIDECIHFEQHAAAANNRNTGPYGKEGRTVCIFILILLSIEMIIKNSRSMNICKYFTSSIDFIKVKSNLYSINVLIHCSCILNDCAIKYFITNKHARFK